MLGHAALTKYPEAFPRLDILIPASPGQGIPVHHVSQHLCFGPVHFFIGKLPREKVSVVSLSPYCVSPQNLHTRLLWVVFMMPPNNDTPVGHVSKTSLRKWNPCRQNQFIQVGVFRGVRQFLCPGSLSTHGHHTCHKHPPRNGCGLLSALSQGG